MKFKDYTWDKEFEIKGYFSAHSDDIISKNNLSGVLNCSLREIVLELFGEFEEKEVRTTTIKEFIVVVNVGCI
ncbi:hypothetical protein N1495_01700 [Streptococcus didelphis]|uniref:Uncharacterized protein n=1 Tax=Streptococcus didelphis TaxID=102886 RepID=A0ABY9LI52_9STRE|nr:hypothetical protein [Streptococcus didelphis]WMB27791.1 hypothetical protein N1496_06890 [Streptococcus didelphis]WMB29747.1 hypothetical protein N1495_01700 [Streptococcus didelphis]